MRGGGYGNSAFLLQVGFRNYGYPYYAFGNYGFRFARTN
jgi:formylglycine-generating enzyme required for sulfatase activity